MDIDLSMKISNGQGAAGGGAGGEPGAGGGPAAGGGPGTGGGHGIGGGQGAGGSPRTPTPTVPPPKPALCPVPCSQTKPTQGPGGRPTVATPPGEIGASSAPIPVPSQGPGGGAQPTTPGEVITAPPTSGGPEQAGKMRLEIKLNRSKMFFFLLFLNKVHQPYDTNRYGCSMSGLVTLIFKLSSSFVIIH